MGKADSRRQAPSKGGSAEARLGHLSLTSPLPTDFAAPSIKLYPGPWTLLAKTYGHVSSPQLLPQTWRLSPHSRIGSGLGQEVCMREIWVCLQLA